MNQPERRRTPSAGSRHAQIGPEAGQVSLHEGPDHHQDGRAAPPLSLPPAMVAGGAQPAGPPRVEVERDGGCACALRCRSWGRPTLFQSSHQDSTSCPALLRLRKAPPPHSRRQHRWIRSTLPSRKGRKGRGGSWRLLVPLEAPSTSLGLPTANRVPTFLPGSMTRGRACRARLGRPERHLSCWIGGEAHPRRRPPQSGPAGPPELPRPGPPYHPVRPPLLRNFGPPPAQQQQQRCRGRQPVLAGRQAMGSAWGPHGLVSRA